MKIIFKNFKNTWYEITLGLKKNEIEGLIEKLRDIQNGDIDHLHISNNFEGEGGIGDIEIYLQDEEEEDNIKLI